MNERNIICPPRVRKKLIQYRSNRFTPEETLNYISQIVSETERLLKNPILGRAYTKEIGEYKGISRIIIKKFKVYFEKANNDIVIIASRKGKGE